MAMAAGGATDEGGGGVSKRFEPAIEGAHWLRDLRFRASSLIDCEYEEVGRDVRLYYSPEKDGNGFEFQAVEWCACYSDEGEWDNPEVHNVVRGVAMYDGIRHIWVGEDGYLNYPNAKTIAAVFTRLRGLEVRLCSHPLEAETDGDVSEPEP